MIPIKEVGKNLTKWVSRHSAELLTVASCVGVCATGYLGVRSGMKLSQDLQPDEEDRTKKDTAKIIFKDVWPVIVAGGTAIASVVCLCITDKKKITKLITVNTLWAEASETYRRKVLETVGPKQEDKILGKIAEEEFSKDDLNDIQVVNTEGGTFLCKDELSNQYFRSSSDYIISMQNKVNRFYLQGENFVTVSEWYSYLGLECPEIISDLGFPATRGVDIVTDDGHLPSCTMPNGEPGYFIKYNVQPMTEEEAELYDMNHTVESVYV